MFPVTTAGTNCIPALVVVLTYLHAALCKPAFSLAQKNDVSAKQYIGLSCVAEMQKCAGMNFEIHTCYSLYFGRHPAICPYCV